MNKIVPIPQRFHIQDNGYEVEISFRWFTYIHLFYLLFAFVWNAFLVNWYAMAMISGNIIMMVFPILHVAAGIYISYLALSGILNKTVIKASSHEIRIQVSPIALWGENKTFSTKDLHQLYVVEEKTREKNGYNYSYALKAIDFQQRSTKLLTVDNSEEAVFLENKLEEICRISDEPVAGEWNSSSNISRY